MRTLLVLFGLLLLAAPSAAQEVENSTVSGTLLSRSATIPAGDTSAELFSVPADAIFVATQVCASSVSPTIISPLPRPIGFNTVSLVGSELGVVPIPGACISFEPGVAFAAGEKISCVIALEDLVDVSCLVTGVLQPGPPGRPGPPWSRSR
jgi:hypothetical protein